MKQKLILMLTFSFMSHIALVGALVYIPGQFFKNTEAAHKHNIILRIIEEQTVSSTYIPTTSSFLEGTKKGKGHTEFRIQKPEVKSKELEARSKEQVAKGKKQKAEGKKLKDVVTVRPLQPEASPEDSSQQSVQEVKSEKIEDVVAVYPLQPEVNHEDSGQQPVKEAKDQKIVGGTVQAEGEGAYLHFESSGSSGQKKYQGQSITRPSGNATCNGSVPCTGAAMTAYYRDTDQMGDGSGASSEDSLKGFLEHLRREIESHKYYPSSARVNGIEGTVYINLRIGNDGRLEDIAIGKSSGSRILDQSAIRTMKSIEEVPHLPEKMRELDITVPIAYRLTEENKN